MKTITLTPVQGVEMEGLGALHFGQICKMLSRF